MSDPSDQPHAVAATPAAARFVFVGGLHRSGTSLLAELLKAHPEVAGQVIDGMPKELEQEGQHVQRVYPVDDALGGPGAFAHNPLAHMTERHPLATAASAARLEADWAPHWRGVEGAKVRLEKSPSNMLRARFLQALWPNSYHLIIVRHPVAVAFATAAWAARHGGGKRAASAASVIECARHWLRAHDLLLADLSSLTNVRIVRLEEFVSSPEAAQRTIDAICADLGLRRVAVGELEAAAGRGAISAGVNRKYWRTCKDEAEAVHTALGALEPRFAAFGYPLASLDPAASAAPAEPSRNRLGTVSEPSGGGDASGGGDGRGGLSRTPGLQGWLRRLGGGSRARPRRLRDGGSRPAEEGRRDLRDEEPQQADACRGLPGAGCARRAGRPQGDARPPLYRQPPCLLLLGSAPAPASRLPARGRFAGAAAAARHAPARRRAAVRRRSRPWPRRATRRARRALPRPQAGERARLRRRQRQALRLRPGRHRADGARDAAVRVWPSCPHRHDRVHGAGDHPDARVRPGG
mmetsp:Transcript_22626/g.72932  ORF Transcript_22626/g.72932 Transcript_22626/m.72932 type:complete len:523 (-) Transcript_22626:718-2286(-)